jgi:hypothetical protein
MSSKWFEIRTSAFNHLKQKTGVGNWPETPVNELPAKGKPLLVRLSIQPLSSLHPPENPNGAESMVQHTTFPSSSRERSKGGWAL